MLGGLEEARRSQTCPVQAEGHLAHVSLLRIPYLPHPRYACVQRLGTLPCFTEESYPVGMHNLTKVAVAPSSAKENIHTSRGRCLTWLPECDIQPPWQWKYRS